MRETNEERFFRLARQSEAANQGQHAQPEPEAEEVEHVESRQLVRQQAMPVQARPMPVQQVMATNVHVHTQVMAQQQRTSIMGIIALLLCIFTVPFALIPAIGFMSLPFSALAGLLAVIALAIALHSKEIGAKLPAVMVFMSALVFGLPFLVTMLVAGVAATGAHGAAISRERARQRERAPIEAIQEPASQEVPRVKDEQVRAIAAVQAVDEPVVVEAVEAVELDPNVAVKPPAPPAGMMKAKPDAMTVIREMRAEIKRREDEAQAEQGAYVKEKKRQAGELVNGHPTLRQLQRQTGTRKLPTLELSVGSYGTIPGNVKVSQVLDGAMIVEQGKTALWISNIRFNNVVDGEWISLEGRVFRYIGTKSFTTVLGARRTVHQAYDLTNDIAVGE